MSLIKVTMNLSEADKANADHLKEVLSAMRSNAQVVSTGLSLLRFIVDEMERSDADLLLRHRDGTYDRIVIPELESFRQQVRGQGTAIGA